LQNLNPVPLNTQPESIRLTFRADLDSEEALQGFMMMQTTVEGIEESSDGLLHYCIPLIEWTEPFKSDLDEFLNRLPARAAAFLRAEPLEIKDWNAAWEASIEPLRASDELVITPSWKFEKAKSLGAKYLMVIDPKMSFGTGHHETTRLCLLAIESLDVASKIVLDVGTGSGVLAMYALMRGASHAIGIDTDQWSIENVEENRGRNGLTDTQFEVKRGTLQTAVDPSRKFDIILANIHRNILLEIANNLAEHSHPSTHLVLSGLLTYDATEVKERYHAAGFESIAELRENEWVALIMKYA
jgi:ribosomal protein L11 methyltransferase